MLKSQQDSTPRDHYLHGSAQNPKMKVIVDGEERFRPIAGYSGPNLPHPKLADGEEYYRTISDPVPTIIRTS